MLYTIAVNSLIIVFIGIQWPAVDKNILTEWMMVALYYYHHQLRKLNIVTLPLHQPDWHDSELAVLPHGSELPALPAIISPLLVRGGHPPF